MIGTSARLLKAGGNAGQSAVAVGVAKAEEMEGEAAARAALRPPRGRGRRSIWRIPVFWGEKALNWDWARKRPLLGLAVGLEES